MADNGPGTLRAAIKSAASGDRITFAPWLFNKTIKLNSSLVINKKLRIEGDLNGDRRADVRLDGQRQRNILKVGHGGELTLWGLSLEHGMANLGGAIQNYGKTEVYFSVINGNDSRGLGGAIYNRGEMRIDSSDMRNNHAGTHGGAIYNAKNGNDKGILNLVDSTFVGNHANQKGGVVYNDSGIFKATLSTFSENKAEAAMDCHNHPDNKGAVLYSVLGSAEFVECTLKGNKSYPETDPELNDCGIRRCSSSCSCRPLNERRRNNANRRQNNGGTLYNVGSAAGNNKIRLTRTVISDSRGRNCGGRGGYTMDHAWSDDNTCNGPDDYSSAGTSNGDPKLGPLADNGGYTHTFKPLDGSGLIDAAGENCLYLDQRNAHRSIAGQRQCDIGSVETGKHVPSRLRPQTINTTPPAEHNEDIAVLKRNIRTLTAAKATLEGEKALLEAEKVTLQKQLASLQNQLAAVNAQLSSYSGSADEMRQLESEIQTHKDRIADLEALFVGSMEIDTGDAGNVTRLTIGDSMNMAYAYRVIYKFGSSEQVRELKDSATSNLNDHADGSRISTGQLQGPNGIIHWRSVSVMVPGSDFLSTRYSLDSTAPFGDVTFGVYADFDLNYNGQSVVTDNTSNALIIGGTNHARRLMFANNVDPDVGIGIGIRGLKNAMHLGWRGIHPNTEDEAVNTHGYDLSEDKMTGVSKHWNTFTPDQDRYPGATGAGPSDIAVIEALNLKHSAKLATFEITVVGAPDGIITD